MRNTWIAIITLILLIGVIQQPVINSEEGYNYLILFYIPYANTALLQSKLGNYGLNSTIISLTIDGVVNPDYYLYWITTGKRPSNENISLLEVFNVDQNRILSLWQNTTLVDIPIVDPGYHTSCINPVMNIENVSLIPSVIKVSINGTIYSSELKTNITTYLVNNKLEVVLEAYNITLKSPNITTYKALGPRLIQVYDTERSGNYTIELYVVNVEEDEITLFFPVALKTSCYSSDTIDTIEATTHWILLVKYSNITPLLTSEAISWWLNRTVNTLQLFIKKAITKTNNYMHVIYIPQLMIARNIIHLDNRIVSSVEERIYEMIIPYVKEVLPARERYLMIFISIGGEENSIVFAPSTMQIDFDLTITQIPSLILPYTQISPFQGSLALYLNRRVSDLSSKVDKLNTTLIEMNTTLIDTSDRLAKCESEKDMLLNETYIVQQVTRLEELEKTISMYIATIVIVVTTISLLLGFLAYRAALKVKRE